MHIQDVDEEGNSQLTFKLDNSMHIADVFHFS